MSEQIGKKFDAQVDYGWGLSLKMTGKAPAISKRIFDKLSDAQNFTDDYNDSAIEGLILAVVSDGKNNGIYFVERIKKSAEDEPSKLIKVSQDYKKLAVESYDEALELATVDNIGQVVYVKEESYYEDSDNDIIEFKPSPYIIVGEKSLIKLITNIEFENIKNEVDNLKSNDEKLQNEINYIKEILDYLGGVDSDYSDKLDELKTKLSILEEEIYKNIQDTTDNLEENDRQIRVDIEDIKKQIITLFSADSDISDDLKNLNISLLNLESAYNQLSQQLNDTSNNLEESDNRIRIDIENIKEQINILFGTDSDISEELDELKNKISDLENNYNQLYQQLNQLSQQTESKFVETNSKINEINSGLTSLKTETNEKIETLKSQIYDKINSLVSQIEELAGVNSDQYVDLEVVTKNIEDINSEISSIREEIENLDGVDSERLNELDTKISSLETQLNELNDLVGDISDTLGTLGDVSEKLNELESIKQTTEELSNSINDINSKIEQIQPKLQWLVL